MKKPISIALLALLASACATTEMATAPAPIAPTAENVAKAIAAAEAANGKAAAVGYEWRDTAQLIEDAKKAAADNEPAKAISLATQAEHQGINAVKQHDAQMEAIKSY